MNGAFRKLHALQSFSARIACCPCIRAWEANQLTNQLGLSTAIEASVHKLGISPCSKRQNSSPKAQTAVQLSPPARCRAISDVHLLVCASCSKRQNGLVFQEQPPANATDGQAFKGASAYFEPHCDFDEASVSKIGQVGSQMSGEEVG